MSQLDLVFTEEPETVGNLEYKNPMGKNDHLAIKLKLSEGNQEEKKKNIQWAEQTTGSCILVN